MEQPEAEPKVRRFLRRRLSETGLALKNQQVWSRSSSRPLVQPLLVSKAFESDTVKKISLCRPVQGGVDHLQG